MKFLLQPTEPGLYWLYGYVWRGGRPEPVRVTFEECSDQEIDDDGKEITWIQGGVVFLGTEISDDLDVVCKRSDYWYGPVVAPQR